MCRLFQCEKDKSTYSVVIKKSTGRIRRLITDISVLTFLDGTKHTKLVFPPPVILNDGRRNKAK